MKQYIQGSYVTVKFHAADSTNVLVRNSPQNQAASPRDNISYNHPSMTHVVERSRFNEQFVLHVERPPTEGEFGAVSLPVLQVEHRPHDVDEREADETRTVQGLQPSTSWTPVSNGKQDNQRWHTLARYDAALTSLHLFSS